MLITVSSVSKVWFKNRRAKCRQIQKQNQQQQQQTSTSPMTSVTTTTTSSLTSPGKRDMIFFSGFYSNIFFLITKDNFNVLLNDCSINSGIGKIRTVPLTKMKPKTATTILSSSTNRYRSFKTRLILK